MQRARVALLALLLTPFAPGCDGGKDEDAGPEAEAQKIWQTRCANCHGMTGAGDGPSAAGLDPKPRSFHSAAWQASVDDARIKKVVVHGGASVGLSPSMAPNPDLEGRDDVLTALVIKLRRMQK